MDRAVILGTYEFIGFHLCLSLLEKGIEVIGIHLPSLSNDEYLEEMRFSVGRNSNFIEMDETFFEQKQTFSDNTFFFIDYYSYYRNYKESEMKAILKQLIDHINVHYIFIFPIQLCNEKAVQEFPIQLMKCQDHVQIYYLPTIYGPWQPLHFTFQQAIDNPDKPVNIDEREWINDALFISDAIDYIIGHLEEKKKQKVLLKSTIDNHWKKAASLLLKNTAIERFSEEVKGFQDVMIVDIDSTIISEGIDLQKRHLEKWKQIKKQE